MDNRPNSNEQKSANYEEDIRKALHKLAHIDVLDVDETKQRRLLQIDANDFRLQQQTDTTLHSYFVRAKSGSAEFVIQNGLLYKTKCEYNK